MKLLDSKSAQRKKQSNSDVDLYKTLKIRESLEKEVLKLREFEDSIPLAKKQAIKEFSAFMTEMQKKKAEILLEIKELEEQRERILEPLIEDKLEIMEAQINARSLEISDKEQKLERNRIDLEKRENALEVKIKALNNFIKQ
jgi:hypothetical protein